MILSLVKLINAALSFTTFRKIICDLDVTLSLIEYLLIIVNIIPQIWIVCRNLQFVLILIQAGDSVAATYYYVTVVLFHSCKPARHP